MGKFILHILIISFVFIAIPITSATGGSITLPSHYLRSHYRSLSLSEVQSMPNVSIRSKEDWGFYGYSTINHDYSLKTIGGDKVVEDNATGLMWHQSGSDDLIEWYEAEKWVEDLNSGGYAGYQDWRLPTVEEAASLLESSWKNGNLCLDPVFSKKQEFIWTGDSYAGWGPAWGVGFFGGRVHYISIQYVRPVRSVR